MSGLSANYTMTGLVTDFSSSPNVINQNSRQGFLVTSNGIQQGGSKVFYPAKKDVTSEKADKTASKIFNQKNHTKYSFPVSGSKSGYQQKQPRPGY